jgi:hypothetical protein
VNDDGAPVVSRPRIVAVRLEEWSPLEIPGLAEGQKKVVVDLDDGRTGIPLFSYYTDDVSITEAAFIGLTVPEAHRLGLAREVAFPALRGLFFIALLLVGIAYRLPIGTVCAVLCLRDRASGRRSHRTVADE